VFRKHYPIALFLSFLVCAHQGLAFDAKARELALWKMLKAALQAPDGASYFEMAMKDSMFPTLQGKALRMEPATNPTTLVLALEDGVTPDATLRFRWPLPGTVDPGTELTFEGVAKSFTATPFMVVFDVQEDDLHGWTGKNPEPARH
jgi:hypothetical protein